MNKSTTNLKELSHQIRSNFKWCQSTGLGSNMRSWILKISQLLLVSLYALKKSIIKMFFFFFQWMRDNDNEDCDICH
jgi:hypothetical protein